MADNTAPTFAGVDYTATTFTSDASNDQFGFDSAGVGDIDGDGFADFVLTAWLDDVGALTDAGSVRLVSGRTGATLFTFTGDSAGDRFGTSVAAGGDIDGDGRGDLLIGAIFDDGSGLTDNGSVRVISGATGATIATYRGAGNNDWFGTSVAGVGDINGDGRDDFVVGAFQATVGGLGSAGSVYVISGLTGATLYTYSGDAAGDAFGHSVAAAGDVDGDGVGDIIFGQENDNGNRGSARVVSGATGALIWEWVGDAGELLGLSVDGAGDIDGDGRADLIVGVYGDDIGALTDAGGARIYSGRTGLALYTIEGDEAGALLGYSVAGIGDVNGDGRPDVMISAKSDDLPGRVNAGSVRIVSGATGLTLFTLEGELANDQFGHSVESAGDVDGDGRDDLLVGAPNDDVGAAGDAGSVRLLTSSTLNNRPTVTSGGAAVVLDANADIRDAELDAADSYAGATLTLSRRGGANASDTFGTSGTLSFSGADVLVGATVVGTFSQADGTLSIAFNAAATSTLADSVLSQLTYGHTAGAQTILVVIAYVFDDGNAGAQGTGGARSAAGRLAVTISQPPVNTVGDARTVDEDTNLSVTGLAVSDTDSASLTATLAVTRGTLTVLSAGGASVTGSGTASVMLTGTAAQINMTLAAADNVVYRGGANVNGADTLTVTTSDGALSDIDTVGITATPVNDAPVATDDTLSDVAEDGGARIITFAELLGNDAAGPANEGGQTLTVTAVSNAVGGTVAIVGGAVVFTPTANFNGAAGFDYVVSDDGTTDGAADPLSDTGRASFTITAVNDAPTLSGFAAALTVAENAAPTVLDADVMFADVDGNFDGGTLSLSGALAEDRLSVRDQGTGTGEIGLSGADVTYEGVTIGTLVGGVGATLTVTFNATAGSAAVDALIENLTYDNVSDTPTASRTLLLNVTDAAGGDLGPGPGPATFAAVTNPFGSAVGLSGLAFLDLDADGDLDAIAGGGNGRVRAFANTAANGQPASFTELTGASNPLALVNVSERSSPAVVDLDGDGDLDVVVGSFGSGLRSFENTATAGSPATFVELSGAANPFNGFSLGFRTRPSFVDIDGDGDQDAVIGRGDGTIAVLRNTAITGQDATFLALTGANNPFNGLTVPEASAPTFIDIDQDGDMDALVGEYAGQVRLFRNTGSSTAPAFAAVAGALFNDLDTGFNAAPSIVDLDADGDLDAFVTGDSLSTFRNTTPRGAPIVVTVTAENDAPVNVVGGTRTVDEDTNLTLSGLSVADADSTGTLTTTLTVTRGVLTGLTVGGGALVTDSGTTSVTLTGTASEINTTLTAANGVVYRGNADANGADTLTMSTSDGATSDVDTATIDVTAINDAPTPTPDTAAALTFGAVSGNLLTNDSDPEGDALSVAAGTIFGTYGRLTLTADGGFVYRADNAAAVLAGDVVTDVLSFSVLDAGAASSPSTLTVTLTGRSTGTAGADIIGGNGAANALRGLAGADQLSGNGGADTLYGEAGDDVLSGGADRDVLIGGAGNDSLDGGDGDDQLQGGLDADALDGGAGVDTLDYRDKTSSLALTLSGATPATAYVDGLAEDTVLNIERVVAGAGNDTLIGDGAANLLVGSDGDDRLKGGGGVDTLDGGSGIDSVDYGDETATVRLTLNGALNASVAVGGVLADVIRGIEIVQGGSGDDSLTGDALANRLLGGDGRDVLQGAGGDDALLGGNGIDTLLGGIGVDVLEGGAGNDSLYGGAGADRFVFARTDGVDIIRDYDADDVLVFNAVSFGLSTSVPAPVDFGAAAVGPGATFVYNEATRTLFFDVDGQGGVAAERILMFATATTLTAEDFILS